MGKHNQSTQRKKLSSKNPYPEKTLFKNEGKIKIFADTQKLGESVISRTTLQEILK